MERVEKKRAFTLVELLVSIAITAIILTTIALMARQGAGLALRSKQINEKAIKLQVLSQLLRRDFLQRVQHFDPIVIRGNDQSVWERDRLGFFLRVPVRDQPTDVPVGDLCFVIYYTAYSPEWGSMELQRLLLASDEVQELRDAGASFEEFIQRASGGNLVSRDVLKFALFKERDAYVLDTVFVPANLIPRLEKDDWSDGGSLLGKPQDVANHASLEKQRLVLGR